MRVLLDQCTPAPLRAYLSKHQVYTAYEQGWGTLLNGKLIKVAEDAGFDVLLTADSHMKNQQNLNQVKLTVVVLSTNHWKSILAAIKSVVDAVDTAEPGLSFVEIPHFKV
jgi:hypothetical protein